MDRAIKKSKWRSKRFLRISLIILIISGAVGVFYLTSGKSKLNVDTERITISEVRSGSFREFIQVSGTVLPRTTIYLDAIEGGRVEEKYVEDGAMVKKGDRLLKLLNTDLELSLSNQETSVFNLLTQMQISRNAAQQNTIMKLNQSSDVESGFIEAERIYKLDRELYDNGVIALQDFKKSENNYHNYLQKKNLTERILIQDSLNTITEMEQAKESYLKTRKSLQIMRRKVEDLMVKAPIDGQITSFDAEIGQNKNKGERLGQIDAADGFKIRADIDEHYISRIFTGLEGEFTIGSGTFSVVIKKVYTQVHNGSFQVDMQFKGNNPTGIRRGQALQIRLALSDITRAVVLPKGGFFQETGGTWIFRLSKSGDVAYKCNIQLGRQNPEYYEVLDGLMAGDRVITSGYATFGDAEELILK
jgi:HlyD family secretion protein